MRPHPYANDRLPATACRDWRCWAGAALALLLVILGVTSSGVLGNGKTQGRAVAEVTAFATARVAASAAATTAANGATFRRTTLSIPTYPYANYLEEAHDPTYNITYPVLDWDR
ncbi:MAG: hypothetical protein ACP5HG_01030, partial [Anaerolineae bacterium]